MSEGPMSEAEAAKLLEEVRLKRFLLAEEQETIRSHVAVCERHGYDEDTAEPIATWLERRLSQLEAVRERAAELLRTIDEDDLPDITEPATALREALAATDVAPIEWAEGEDVELLGLAPKDGAK